jgi:hypothetical protein
MSWELDTWIRTQPGRCQVCGFHIQMQGHRADCPAASGPVGPGHVG